MIEIDPKWISPEWSEADIRLLEELWLGGEPIIKIGKTMKRTQNAVHGKLNRVGLAGTGGAAPRPSPIKPKIEPAVVKAKSIPWGVSTLPSLPSELAQQAARS